MYKLIKILLSFLKNYYDVQLGIKVVYVYRLVILIIYNLQYVIIYILV